MQLGPYIVTSRSRPLIVAELGINHDGDVELAREMVKEAVYAGADIVKFQLHMPQFEMLVEGPTADYIEGESFYELLDRTWLPLTAYAELKRLTEDLGVMFLCTPFCREAAVFLNHLGVSAFKIGSGECTNIPLVQHIAKLGKPVILSTGMATFNDIEATLRAVGDYAKNFILMNCTSTYPTPYCDVRLRRITGLYRRFGLLVGQSDHSIGITTALGAVALNAVIIEKHVTMDKTMAGPDQAASIDMDELADLVERSYHLWMAMSYYDEIARGEAEVAAMAHHSLVSIQPIKCGEALSYNNIWTKRPGTGIPAARLQEFLGRHARVDIPTNSLIQEWDIGA